MKTSTDRPFAADPQVRTDMVPLPGEDQVHVWEVRLSEAEGDSAGRVPPLSPDEWERADRFHFVRDRVAFIAARSWLRDVLSAYLDIGPDAVRFAYGEAGKPRLAPDQSASGLSFNLSHSGGRAALAVVLNREIGIDIEEIRPVEPNIVGRFFAPGEIATWSALDIADRLPAFFACWTRKEAFLKATGLGLGTIPLDAFEVSLAPNVPPEVLSVADDPAEAERWQLTDLALGPDFAGALALRSRGWRVLRMPPRGHGPNVSGR